MAFTPMSSHASVTSFPDSNFFENGQCYLALFRDNEHPHALIRLGHNPTVWQLGAYATEFPGNFYSGKVQATLGTSYGVSINQVKHISITRVSATESRLTPRELLVALPPSWMVGGLDGSSPSHLSSSAPPSSALSAATTAVINTTSSRPISFLTPGATIKAGQTESLLVHSICSSSPVSSAAYPWGVATVSDLSVTFSPTINSSCYFLEVHYAWFPDSDSAPGSVRALSNYPNSGYLVLAPPVPGGFWNATTLSCPVGKDLLSAFIRPSPSVGGVPNLALWVSWEPLPGHQVVPDSVLFNIYSSVILTIGA